jgi:ABC-type Fe3+ transport system permease subunit
MAAVALALIMATSFGLLVLGRRFLRRYVARHGTQPPATWMFHRSEDPELESTRRVALGLLPFYLVAAVVYLLRPG